MCYKSHIHHFQKQTGNTRKVVKTLCNLGKSATFVAESIKSSSQTADSPTELQEPRWPRYDAEAVYSLQKILIMKENNSSYKFHVARLSSMPVSQLVELFNKEVGNRGWTSERSAFDAALIDAFINKGVDVFAVYDGTSISFRQKVTLDSESQKLIALV